MNKKHTGFTLIELMITLVIASIVLTVGVPSLQTFIVNNRMTTNTNDLISALHLARSEAIKRGINIDVCSSSNQTSCGGSWADGWIVITAPPAPAATEIIRVHGKLKGKSTISSDNGNILTYTSSGFLTGTTTIFTLCDSAESGEKGRTITIIPTGRANNLTPYPICS